MAADNSLPGITVSVVKHGELAYAQDFGVANPESSGPVTKDCYALGFTADIAGVLLNQ